MTETLARNRAGARQSAVLATVVVIAVVGFIMLAHSVRIGPTYAGLLFFWYWAAIGQANFANLPAMLTGALVGVAIAWLLQWASLSGSPAAVAGVILVIVVAIYLQVMEIIPVAVNLSTMLFLTVAGAPLLQGSENFLLVALSIVLAALYFGCIVFVLSRIARRSTAAPGVPG